MTRLFAFGALIVAAIVFLQACGSDDENDAQVPAIMDFAPKEGLPATVVTIYGSNFNALPDQNIVRFNGVTATVTEARSTSLKVTVPTGATTGKITVQVGDQQITSFDDFTVIPPATITEFSPTGGIVGTSLTITGSNFSTAEGAVSVKINGVEETVTEVTATTIKVVVQTNTTTGKIEVRSGTQVVSTATDFTYAPVTVSTFAGAEEALSNSGYENGPASTAKFASPFGVTVDKDGTVYVADLNNSRIRKISTSMNVTTLADVTFSSIYGVVVDATGNVFVGESGNHRIRKVSPSGEVTTFAGSGAQGSVDGNGIAAQFDTPTHLAIDAGNNIYVVEKGRIRKVTPNGTVTTIAGNGTAGYADGNGEAAMFNDARGIAVDASGNLYIGDSQNHRIRKVTQAGQVTTLAGNFGGYVDGKLATASFEYPGGIAIDGGGNLYVSDEGNQVVRKITPDGVVVTLAGDGTYGFINGAGEEARFRNPSGLAVDASGNVYIADQSNNVIRKVAMP